MSDDFDWVDKQEEERKKNSPYFEMKEGDNRFVLLSHCAPLVQVYEGGKYRAAKEGDDPKSISTKGLCWIYQDGMVKEAKLPYLAVKAIRALQQNQDWEFAIPFPHVLTLNAVGAGTKEVKYSLIASPKVIEIPPAILEELKKKPAPEDIVAKIKGDKSSGSVSSAPDYPEEKIDPADIPF